MRHDDAIRQLQDDRTLINRSADLLRKRLGVAAERFFARPVGLSLLAALLLSSAAAAQDDGGSPDAESKVDRGRVIVTQVDAKLQIADKPARPLPTGRVLEYSRTNGPWLWVDELWGWVNKDAVLPLDEAETYYTELAEKAAKERDSIEAADGDSADAEANREKRAALSAERTVALHQRGIVRYALGRNKEAISDFDAAIEGGYKYPQVHLNRGNALLAVGDFDEAIDAITEAVAIEPTFGRAYDARAIALATKEFYEAAHSDAKKATELQPKAAAHWYTRGKVERSLGDYAAAVTSLNEAVKLSPRYVQAVTDRGYSLKRLGRLEEAVSDYRRAIEIDPELAVSHNDLAWLLATTKEKSLRDGEEAVELAERAVELAEGPAGKGLTKSEIGQYHDTLAAAYASVGEWEKAEASAREAVSMLDGADQYGADERLTMYLNKKPYVEK